MGKCRQMLNLYWKTFLSFMLSLSLSFSALGGEGAGSSGGGADTFSPSAKSAWFIGPGKKINVCIDVASDFGMPNGFLNLAKIRERQTHRKKPLYESQNYF